MRNDTGMGATGKVTSEHKGIPVFCQADPGMDSSRIEAAYFCATGHHQRPPDQEVVLQQQGKRFIGSIQFRINLTGLDPRGIGVKPILHR